MKRSNALVLVLLAGAFTLCGCGNSDSKGSAENISKAETSVTAASSAGTVTGGSEVTSAPDTSSSNDSTGSGTDRPRESSDSLTGSHTIGDYTVKARFEIRENATGVFAEYEGEITDVEELRKVWTMLCAAEAEAPEEYPKVDGGMSNSTHEGYTAASLTLVPKWGGREVVISDGIAYENEMVEGGPRVMAFNGLTTPGGNVFNMKAAGEFDGWLTRFCTETIVPRGEIVKRTEPETNKNPSVENSNVVLVSRYSNWAWNVYDKVSFIDTKGDVYSLTLAEDEGYDYECPKLEDLLPRLEKMIADENVKPAGKVSEEEIQAVRQLGAEIPADAKMTEDKSVMCDGGQTTLYVITDKIIELRSIGDNEHELDDPTARKLCGLYDWMIKKTTSGS